MTGCRGYRMTDRGGEEEGENLEHHPVTFPVPLFFFFLFFRQHVCVFQGLCPLRCAVEKGVCCSRGDPSFEYTNGRLSILWASGNFDVVFLTVYGEFGFVGARVDRKISTPMAITAATPSLTLHFPSAKKVRRIIDTLITICRGLGVVVCPYYSRGHEVDDYESKMAISKYVVALNQWCHAFATNRIQI